MSSRLRAFIVLLLVSLSLSQLGVWDTHVRAIANPPLQTHTKLATVGLPQNLTAGLYEPTWENASDGRSSLQLLQGMHANFVMRGFFKFGRTSDQFWLNASESIVQLKYGIPNLFYEGSITASILVTHPRDTWANGSEISDSDFYAMLGKGPSGKPIRNTGFPNAGYFADLASPLYRQYLVGWSEREVDVGVDGIHFDGIYTYAKYKVKTMGEDPNQVSTEYAGYFKMVVNELKSYAASKGRSFYAARNGGICALSSPIYLEYPALLQADDIVACSFLHEDFDPTVNPTLMPLENFAQIKSDILRAAGRELPIITYMDWAGRKPETELSKFVELNAQQRIQSLTNIDAATKSAGIHFAYPVYGGDTVFGTYDSVKYGTYDTIVALATGTTGNQHRFVRSAALSTGQCVTDIGWYWSERNCRLGTQSIVVNSRDLQTSSIR